MLTVVKRDGSVVQARLTIPAEWVRELGINENVPVKLVFDKEGRRVIVEFPSEPSSSD